MLRSVPLLDAAGDDVVTSLVQVLDWRVCLGDFVDFGVTGVRERGRTRRTMRLV